MTLNPLLVTWGRGEVLYRAHSRGADPRRFNNGHGPPTRFAFFAGPSGTALIPVWYAGSTLDVAIAERLFHDLPVGARAVLPYGQYQDVAYSRVAPRRDLSLVALHDSGLRRLGLRNDQICDTDAIDYPDTVLWAQALHARTDLEVDGLVWMSRHFNTERAVVLFGDRVLPADIDVDTRTHDVEFRSGAGLGALLIAASRADVLVETPSTRYLTG